MSNEGDASEFNPATRAPAEIPDAWRELVSRRDPVLIDLVSSVVERRTGHRPDASAVIRFLTVLADPAHLEVERTSESHPGMRGPSIYPSPRKRVDK